jgi:hypothetical protein
MYEEQLIAVYLIIAIGFPASHLDSPSKCKSKRIKVKHWKNHAGRG